jgi:hypothetical protein
MRFEQATSSNFFGDSDFRRANRWSLKPRRKFPVTTAGRPVPAPERSDKQTCELVHQPENSGARPCWPEPLLGTHIEKKLCVKISKTFQKHAQYLYKATIRKVKTKK